MTPVMGKEVFGREADLACLDQAWANPKVNVVTFIRFRESNRSWLRIFSCKSAATKTSIAVGSSAAPSCGQTAA